MKVTEVRGAARGTQSNKMRKSKDVYRDVLITEKMRIPVIITARVNFIFPYIDVGCRTYATRIINAGFNFILRHLLNYKDFFLHNCIVVKP